MPIWLKGCRIHLKDEVKGALLRRSVNSPEEVRLALLEADVNFKVVKNFVARIKKGRWDRNCSAV